MNDKKKQIQIAPKRRLHPTDGLAITAKIWAKAHDYHRLSLHAHQSLIHAPGVLLGLEVISSEPPESIVYILPGIALSPHGEFIIVEEPVAYDLGSSKGALTIWLTYAEGPPQSENDPESGAVSYVSAQFGVEAQPSHIMVPGVELARVHRTTGKAPIKDALVSHLPQSNEIDLRFRAELSVPPSPARMAVSRLGKDGKNDISAHKTGSRWLAQELRHAGQTPLWVDVDIPLDNTLNSYNLLYLVMGSAEVETEVLNSLYDYLQNDGIIFIEVAAPDEKSIVEAALFEILGSLGITLEPVTKDHRLMTSPHLFATIPGAAQEDNENAPLLIGEGIIFSRAQLGAAWCGRRSGALLTRAEIRAAHEWGENLIRYALAERK